MRLNDRLGALVVTILLTASCASPTANAPAAEAPSPTGTLVFHRFDLDERPHVWTSCADRTGLRQLTDRTGYSEGWPTWSPGGSRIAFNANWDDPDLDDDLEIWDVYTMARDGSDVRRLTRATGLAGDPDWSPDGNRIAFGSTERGREGIWILNVADGSEARLVTPSPAGIVQDYAPRFAPDGVRLVFTRAVSDTEAALHVVNVDGTGLGRLTPASVAPEKADWSPDGSRILFGELSDAVQGDVWTIAPDGTELTNLTAAPSAPGLIDGYSHPVWSPDGTQILVVHGLHPNLYRHGLALIQADGGGTRWIGPEARPRFEKLLDWTAAPC